MGSLMTSESQDTRLTSHPKDGTLDRAVSPITALGHWDIFLDQRKECLLLALQHHLQQHLVSHPGTDQDQPCLASEASQQCYAGWYAAGDCISDWVNAPPVMCCGTSQSNIFFTSNSKQINSVFTSIKNDNNSYMNLKNLSSSLPFDNHSV